MLYSSTMENESLKIIVEIQRELIELRCAAADVAHPKLQKHYLALAEMIERLTRELDRISK